MTPRPLTDDERRAAVQLGQGATQQAAADGLGVSVKTVRRLTKREDFAALIEEARESEGPTDLDWTPDEPKVGKQTPREVLEEMLTATNKCGEPVRTLRMQAAVALSKLPDDTNADRVIERVYVTRDHPDHDQVVGVLDATPPDQSVGVVDADESYRILADRDVPDAVAATIHALSGPSSASTGDEPASPADQPTPDQPPSGRGE